ncbi:MAG: hypothetical protein ACI3Y0_11710 [Prevotella sp.]
MILHFINDFTCYQPIVTGSDTYELTYNDLQMLSIYLPYGYQWVYDSYYMAVIITVVNSIDEIFSDDGNAADIYDVKGVKVGNTRERKQLPDGLYIVNGKTIMLKQK